LRDLLLETGLSATLTYVYPNLEWNGKQFADAHHEADKHTLQEQIKHYPTGYSDAVKN